MSQIVPFGIDVPILYLKAIYDISLNKTRGGLQLRPSINQLPTVNGSKTKIHLSAPEKT